MLLQGILAEKQFMLLFCNATNNLFHTPIDVCCIRIAPAPLHKHIQSRLYTLLHQMSIIAKPADRKVDIHPQVFSDLSAVYPRFKSKNVTVLMDSFHPKRQVE